MKKEHSKKINLLLRSIIFDIIGVLSFVIPGVGEFSDVIWAPLSAYLIIKMYKGSMGKVAGFLSLIEEGLPGFDIIPTFTMMWVYKYYLKPVKKNV